LALALTRMQGPSESMTTFTGLAITLAIVLGAATATSTPRINLQLNGPSDVAPIEIPAQGVSEDTQVLLPFELQVSWGAI
jgi:hypothetical protein